MAQKQVKTKESLFGYIHDVTPIKLSTVNNKYFSATLQTDRENYHHCVIFAAEKNLMWATAAKKQTAVKTN